MLGLDVNASQVQCTVERGGVRLGLGYIKGVASAEMQALVAERERNGPFASLGELAARVGCRRGTLEQLAWSGACDDLAGADANGHAEGHGRQAGPVAAGGGDAGRDGGDGPVAGAARRPSSRCPWSCRRRRACARSGAGSG